MYFLLKLISPSHSCGLFANGNSGTGGEEGKKKKKKEAVWWQLWLHGSPTALQEKINS